MYFDFSKEQYAARDSARVFLEQRMPTARLRQLLESDTGFDPEVWRGTAELGWTSVLVPEAHGGLGLGFLDLALLLEESGRALLPAPFVETAVMLPLALRAGHAAQQARWLPRIALGETIGTVAFGGREGLPFPAGVSVSAQSRDGVWDLDGEALLVPFAAVAGVVLTAAHLRGAGHESVGLFLVEPGDPGVSWQALPGLDPAYRLGAMRLQGVRLAADRLIGGEQGSDDALVRRVLQAGRTALALQAVGGAGRALEMAVEYAKVRQQFGRPIGSFQAIKHKCAEMLVAYETARSGAYYAAWAVDTGIPDAMVAAAMAKATSTEMFRLVAGEAIQIHGGIGFTWEHDLHFFFKRAKYLEFALGTPAQQREIVAAARFSRPRTSAPS